MGETHFIRSNKMNNLFTISIMEKYWVSLNLVGNLRLQFKILTTSLKVNILIVFQCLVHYKICH